MRIKFVIERVATDSTDMRTGEQTQNTPYCDRINALLSSSGFLSYVAKHGLHFSDKLAKHASEALTNVNGVHTWAAADIKKAVADAGIVDWGCYTLGDITYLSNLYYSDFYPFIIQNEDKCIRAACKAITDPDGYNGMPFCRWLADKAGKGCIIDFTEYI